MKTGSFLAWILLAAASFAATPVPVILDTDMSGDCDDAGTLALLHALADRGECDLLAVVTNRRDLANASAAAADAIDMFYGRPDLPVGVGREQPTALQRTSLYTPALRDGFPHDAKPDDEMPDALDIYRTVLAARPDGSVTICGVGSPLRQPRSHRRRPAELRPGRGPLRRARPRPRTLERGGTVTVDDAGLTHWEAGTGGRHVLVHRACAPQVLAGRIEPLMTAPPAE